MHPGHALAPSRPHLPAPPALPPPLAAAAPPPLPRGSASESEADAIGLRLLARSCYDPGANVTMLQRLAAAEAAAARGAGGGGGGRAGGEARGGRLEAMLRTHPLTRDRVDKVKELLPEAYKTYSERCRPLRDAWSFG